MSAIEVEKADTSEVAITLAVDCKAALVLKVGVEERSPKEIVSVDALALSDVVRSTAVTATEAVIFSVGALIVCSRVSGSVISKTDSVVSDPSIISGCEIATVVTLPDANGDRLEEAGIVPRESLARPSRTVVGIEGRPKVRDNVGAVTRSESVFGIGTATDVTVSNVGMDVASVWVLGPVSVCKLET